MGISSVSKTLQYQQIVLDLCMCSDSDYNHVCEVFFKYMSFIVTDIQCVEINKDLERKLSKTYNLDLASEVREKNITCPGSLLSPLYILLL